MDDDFFIGKPLNKYNFFYYEQKEKRVVPSLSNILIFKVLMLGFRVYIRLKNFFLIIMLI